jgi:hypothetical protein
LATSIIEWLFMNTFMIFNGTVTNLVAGHRLLFF